MSDNILEAILGPIPGKYKVIKTKDSRIREFAIIADNRAEIKANVQQALVKKKIEFMDVQRHSTIKHDEFNDPNDAKRTRIVYRPAKISMTRQTELVEAAFCVYLAAFIAGFEDLGGQDLGEAEFKHKIKPYFNIGRTNYNSVQQYMEQSEPWKKTSIASAEVAYKKLKLNKSFVTHRGTAFVKKIYDNFRKFKSKDKALDGIRIGDDKWNPSDVWITNKASLSIPEFETLDEYTNWITKLAKDKVVAGISIKSELLYGVSLKQSGVKLIDGTNVGTIKLKSKKIKKQKTSMSAKNTSIILTKDSKYDLTIDFRAVKPNTDTVGEIIGTSARHGKVSMSIINLALGSSKVRSIKQIINGTTDYLSEISRLYRTIGMNFTIKQLERDLEDKNNNEVWLSAKVQSLETASKILNHPKANQVARIIFNYADSKGLGGKFSASAYYKIV